MNWVVRLINRGLCRLRIHETYYVESTGGLIVEHCRHCGREVPLYRRRH
ncbi:MAG: hypothetical protein ABR598_03900 [Candidatus Dormibacteria bacterium]